MPQHRCSGARFLTCPLYCTSHSKYQWDRHRCHLPNGGTTSGCAVPLPSYTSWSRAHYILSGWTARQVLSAFPHLALTVPLACGSPSSQSHFTSSSTPLSVVCGKAQVSSEKTLVLSKLMLTKRAIKTFHLLLLSVQNAASILWRKWGLFDYPVSLGEKPLTHDLTLTPAFLQVPHSDPVWDLEFLKDSGATKAQSPCKYISSTNQPSC